MTTKPNETIENIKKEAKQYYQGKNMIPRYIVIGFLLILIILQFILPKQSKNLDKLKSEINIEKNQSTDNLKYTFLDTELYLDFVGYELEEEMAKILDKKEYLAVLYNKSHYLLSDLESTLKKEGLPTDLKYLILTNELGNLNRPINLEAKDKYSLRIDQNIDESLNYQIAKTISIDYIKGLYKDFQDWNLVVIGYLIGSDNLKSNMMSQDQKDFQLLYFSGELMEKYFNLVAYKNIFENISDYIDINKLNPIEKKEYNIVKVGEIKDLVKRADKEGYSFKKIKELNPRILGNGLPKGKREIVVER